MPGLPIQAVFFDLDGTLVDHDAATRAGALRMFSRYRDRLTGSDERLLRRWEESTELHFDRYLRGEISYAGQRRWRIWDLFDVTPSEMPDAEADEAFAVYRDAYERNWELFPDVVDTLEALSSYRLGVITNGGSVHQRQKLEGIGVLDRFAAVVASEDEGVAKPAPGIFKVACQAVTAPPSACVHVGDRLDVDAIGACDAGLRGVWLDRHDEGLGPTCVTRITRLTELPALVLER
jgi:putative hydrolase of the HAD superfamily